MNEKSTTICQTVQNTYFFFSNRYAHSFFALYAGDYVHEFMLTS